MTVLDVSKPILVYLANGVQGGAVCRAVIRRGHKARALVRDARRAQALAALGAELVEGDLRDPSSLRHASQGVAHVVLQVPIGTEADMRTAAANALAAATGCRSVVLKLAGASRRSPCVEPSFVANAAIEDMVRRSGLPFAIVRPTMYLDNLLKPSARVDIVERGLFSVPIAADQRIAWTCADDCAEAAVTLLERGVYGGDHRVAGSEDVTGDGLVAAVSQGLGRQVVFRPQPLDAFEREVDAAMGAGTGRRVGSKFRFFAAHPDEAAAMLSGGWLPQEGLESFQPTGIAAWVRSRSRDFLAGR